MSPSFDTICENILSELLGLKVRFPHFTNLNRSHIEGHRLEYVHGHRRVPNPNYKPGEKHKVAGPRSKYLDEWEEDGIRLLLTLEREPMEEARGSAPVEDPDWSDIELRAYREDRQSHARVGEVHASFRIQGRDPDGPIRTAILEILRGNIPPGV